MDAHDDSFSKYDAAAVTHPGGVRARRAFPTNARSHLDPFVLFERFFIGPEQGFPTHPHAGFEILTYVLEGGMDHADSLGHETTARAGDAMRITAGRGIRHSEFSADGPCSGLQLWVNLPRDRKEIDPSYADASSEDLPTAETGGATVRTVVGEGSSIDFETPMEYLDVTISDSRWTWELPEGWVGFCFVVSGSATVVDGSLEAGNDAASLEASQFVTTENGDSATFETESRCRLVAVAGDPHGEPICQRGPFVA